MCCARVRRGSIPRRRYVPTTWAGARGRYICRHDEIVRPQRKHEGFFHAGIDYPVEIDKRTGIDTFHGIGEFQSSVPGRIADIHHECCRRQPGDHPAGKHLFRWRDLRVLDLVEMIWLKYLSPSTPVNAVRIRRHRSVRGQSAGVCARIPVRAALIAISPVSAMSRGK